MNLVTIAEKWKNKEYKTQIELKKDLDKIEIFKPEMSDDVAEYKISFNGNKNSFLEVGEFVFNSDYDNYAKFVKLVKSLIK